MDRPVRRSRPEERAGIGQFADFAGELQADAAGRQHTGVKLRPTPNCLNSTVILPSRSRDDRHREFAAGQKFRGFAADRGEIGFCQHMHQADLFQGLENALGIVGAMV